MELTAKDYPTFFKVNHYKKHKEKEFDEGYDEEGDLVTESDSKDPSYYGAPGRKNILGKRDRASAMKNVKEEEQTSEVIYHSGSEESENEDLNLNVYQEPQEDLQQKGRIIQGKPYKLHKGEGKTKFSLNGTEVTGPVPSEQEMPKEHMQSFKEVPQRRGDNTQFAAGGFEHAFGRSNPNAAEQGNQSFRFYPTDNAHINNQTLQNNGFVQSSNFNGNHAAYPNANAFPMATAQNNFQNNQKKQNMLRGFGNLNMPNMGGMPNMGNINNMNGMVNMANMSNMANQGNDETFNAMFKGLPPLGFAIGGVNPFMSKTNPKTEMNEKLLETAQMMKYFNGQIPNGYGGQKMYPFHPNENGKTEEVDHMNNIRTKTDQAMYEAENDYSEMAPYLQGNYRLENAIPSNLPSAYFSSKKFNFEGPFEDERFNDFSDPKKKLKALN